MDAQLQIRHIGYQDDKPQFVVVRGSDMKWGSETALTPPELTIVPGRPNNNLQQDLRWYLEQFLELPLGAYLDTAERVQTTLQEWGSACFDSLFQKQARDWFQDARRQGLENLTLKIASNDPRVLAWPWEALHDPEGGTLAHHCRIERQLSELHDPLPLPVNLPKDRINILLVIARPYGDKDVGFHALSRPLVELTKAQNSPVHIDVLRPPTFDQLRQTLRDKPGFYHIVHFDGHGGYGTPGHTSPHAFKGMQGMLVFEDDHAEPANVDAGVLSQLMAEHRIPIMVLNACQSAKIDEQADDAFASVAAALLKAGIRSVVAMGYNLYVSGAQQFVPAFYQRLLSSGNVAEAARAGRQAMLAHPERVCVLGEHNLQDWLVPVLYQQLPPGEAVLPNIQRSAPAFVFPGQSETETPLPEAAQYLGDYGFIGRERAVQALERARLQQPQAAFLIHGMAGIGKTTLAKGFLHWLYDTNGLAQDLPNGGVFWFSFDEIRSVEYVINAMVDPLFGTNARAAPLQQKLEVLTKALREHPFLLVWDNFESASGIAGTEVTALLPEDDRQLLKDLLKRLRGGKTKVLITSRSPENWLTPQECYRLPLSGLQGEELWEYCNAVVRDLGLTIDRKQDDFQKLIAELDGHPLAIRAILLRLPERKATELLVELKQQFTGADGDESTIRIMSTLNVVIQCFPNNFTQIFQFVGLHYNYIEIERVGQMLERFGGMKYKDHMEICFESLENIGLLQNINGVLYKIHPALTSYLQKAYPATIEQKMIFSNFIAWLCTIFADTPAYQRDKLLRVYKGSIYAALSISEENFKDEFSVMILQLLKESAVDNFSYREAYKLTEQVLEKAIKLKRHDGIAMVFGQLARLSEKLNQISEAKSFYEKGLVLVNTYALDAGVCISLYRGYGDLNKELGEYLFADELYTKALSVAEKSGTLMDVATIKHQMAINYLKQRQYGHAKDFHNAELEIYRKHNEKSKISAASYQMSRISQEEGNFSEAMTWAKNALSIDFDLNDEVNMAMTYHQLGVISRCQNDLESAKIFYMNSLQINEKRNNQKDAALSYYELAMISYKENDFNSSANWICLSAKHLYSYADDLNLRKVITTLRAILRENEMPIKNIFCQHWQEAGLEQIITLDQLEQQLNDNT
jgi:tetratricopeptide (TPR) repeat protein